MPDPYLTTDRDARPWRPTIAGQYESANAREIVDKIALHTFAPLADAETSGEFSKPVERSIRHVMREFSGETDARDMAAAGDLSPFHFSRKFRRETGMTPAEFLRRYRIVQAMHLLRNGETKIGEIARAVGYNDHAAFTRAFRGVVGTHPSMFRATQSRRSISVVR